MINVVLSFLFFISPEPKFPNVEKLSDTNKSYFGEDEVKLYVYIHGCNWGKFSFEENLDGII